MGDGVPDGPTMSRSDLRLVAQAVRGKWRVPEAAFDDVPRELYVLATTAEAERTKVAAAKVLDLMLKSNREEEEHEARAPADTEAAPRIVIPGAHAGPRP